MGVPSHRESDQIWSLFLFPGIIQKSGIQKRCEVDKKKVLAALHMDIHSDLDERIERLDLELPVEDDLIYTQEKPDLKKIPKDKWGGSPIVFPNRLKTGKRTVSQRERDFADEQRLYLEGATFYDIAAWIGENRDYKIGLAQIRKDIDKIEERWRLAYLGDMNDMKVRELKKIDKVEMALWMAWDKSLMDIVETQNTTVTGINDTNGKDEENSEEGEQEEQKVELNKRGRPKTLYGQGKGFRRTRFYEKRVTTHGDTNILVQVLACVELRSKILGLITNKVSVSRDWRKEAEDMGFDPQEIIDGFREKIIDAAVDRGRFGGSDEGQQENPPELPNGGETTSISD